MSGRYRRPTCLGENLRSGPLCRNAEPGPGAVALSGRYVGMRGGGAKAGLVQLKKSCAGSPVTPPLGSVCARSGPAPGRTRGSVALWQGRWPCHWSREGAVVSAGGTRKRDPRFPRPRATVPRRPEGPGEPEASARPGGGEAPAVGGSGAGRGLWPPAAPVPRATLWQGRWPLPRER